MILKMELDKNGYDITIERGALNKAGELFNLKRKVLIVTDSGVPNEYSKTVASQCEEFVIQCVAEGEESKSFDTYKKLLSVMLEEGFTRTDCIVAVGGGVVGDLAGFIAASFMRGIDFYNIPTTLLSQIDSSVGGKVAINLDNIKNIVGAFYQPKKVIIDPEVLKTLPKRQISNGLAEAIKMSLTSKRELFELFEKEDIDKNIDKIIIESLKIKKSVVELDEKEQNLRRILNFGHTIGHGIESSGNLKELYHGECVALGMLPMCSKEVRSRLFSVLEKVGLPTKTTVNREAVINAVCHDKKFDRDRITAVFVDTIGEYNMKKITKDELANLVGEVI